MMLRGKLYVPSVTVKHKCSKFYLRSVLFSEVSHLSCSCFLSLVVMVDTRGACVEGTTKEDSHILLFTSAFMLLLLLSMWQQPFFSKVLHPLFLRVLVSCLVCSYARSQRMSKDRNALPSIPVSVQLVARPRRCCCCCCCPQFPGCCLQLQRPSHVTCAPSHPNLYWLFKTIIDKSSTSFREEA